VFDAPVRFGQIIANYAEIETEVMTYSTGSDIYDDIAARDTDGVCDPRTNVTIDGVKHEADRDIGKGTWHWQVSPGQVFEHDLVISKKGALE
jgi:hypothetical protein